MRLQAGSGLSGIIIFQSTHSMKECDFDIDNTVDTLIRISIHALYERVRRYSSQYLVDEMEFQSTHSMKECDLTAFSFLGTKTVFQSTHSMKECDGCH